MDRFGSKKQLPEIGLLLVIAAGICWGLLSIFVRGLNRTGLDSLQIVGVRSWITAIVLLVFFLIHDRAKLKIRLRDLWMFIGSGIISTAFFNYCYFSSIVLSGAAVSVVLLYTSPIFVMLMSAVIFRERITKRKLVALFLTFGGCMLMAGFIGSSSSMSVKALLLGLGAGFGYALYSIFAGFAVRRYSSLTITFYSLLFTALSTLFLTDIKKTAVLLISANTEIWGYAFGIAIICTLIPYAAYTAGLARMEAGRAAVLVTIEPLVGTILGVFAFGEAFDIYKALGIVLIFSAVFLLSRNKHSISEEKNEIPFNE